LFVIKRLDHIRRYFTVQDGINSKAHYVM